MKDPKLFIVHILEAIRKIQEYAEVGRDAFLLDSKTQDAVVRNFEIIGEAAKRVPEDVRKLEPQIPWRRIAGFRDVLIHQYEGVDWNIVWQNIEKDLALLEGPMTKLLAMLEKNSRQA